MNCPSCNQMPSTFLESIFSLRGVSLKEAMQLHFKCRHCHTLLHITNIGKETGLFLGLSGALLALLAGTGIASVILFVALAILVFVGFSFCLWKYGEIQPVANSTTSAKNTAV